MTAAEGLRYLKSVRDADPLMGEIADAIIRELCEKATEIRRLKRWEQTNRRWLDKANRP